MNADHDLTHLDLFSGIGGFALAAKRAGFRTVGCGEIEPYCCGVLKRRGPAVRNFGNVRHAAFPKRFRNITVISAGYPCQPESVAGKRAGPADDRWLWPAACGIVEALRPTWFIGENVLGHVSMGLDTVLSDLDRIGYAAQPFVVPTCAVGTWHRRDRVWVLAALSGEGDAPQTTANAVCPRREELDAAAEPTAQAQGDNWHAPVGADALRYPCWDADFTAVLRMADGLSLGLDSSERNGRIRALGNAIVPQVAEKFFRWIRQIEEQSRMTP